MFTIALVGRPNVGKSTLFNYLVGKKIAIIDDLPGVTRDRKIANGSLFDLNFSVVDTGGYDDQNDTLNKKIWSQAKQSISSADAILFIVDGRAGMSPYDKELAEQLRLSKKPVCVCINKSDVKVAKDNAFDFYELGFDTNILLSAEHSFGISDIHSFLAPLHKAYTESNPESEESSKQDLTVAFVGKPNVGKSTIINTLLNEDRLITNNEAGTTRDAIYLDKIYKHKKIKIIDTAGLRRRSKVDAKLEKLSNSDTITAINFATVAVLVISAEEGLTKQDLTLASHIVKEGRGLIVLVNKIDLIKNQKHFLENIKKDIEFAFYQIKAPYVIGISALKDKDILHVLDKAFDLYEKWQFRVSTSLLNKWLANAKDSNPAPTISGIRLKIKYASQLKTRPPTFNLWANMEAKKVPEHYIRYLVNDLYKTFEIWGCTIRINIKHSDNPYNNTKKRS